MKNVRSLSSLVQVAGLLFIALAFVAWQPDRRSAPENKNSPASYEDTTLPKSTDIDEIDLQLNLDSIMQQVNSAMQKIDYAKMNADVQKAMAGIDYKKINKEIAHAMKTIDWSKMKTDMAQSLDSAKMAIDKINWDEIKANVSQAQAESAKAMARQKINIDSLQRQVQKSLREAQKSLQLAKAEMTNEKALKTALERDGLLQAGQPYTIEVKNGILYISGVKQSKAITEKYSQYYSNRKNFILKNDGEAATQK